MRLVMASVFAVAGLFVWGCGGAYGGGEVTAAGPGGVRADGPDVTFTTASGSSLALSRIRQPVLLIGFVAPPGEACCMLSPELVGLADHYWNLPVTVAQVSLPTTQCPHGAGCTEACRLREGRLVALCDSGRLAWKAYGQPKTNTVLLFDDHNKLLGQAKIGNLEGLRQKAGKLGTAIRQKALEEEKGADHTPY